MTTDTLDSVNVGYDTNAVHQYTAVGATTPTYDANGNITSGYGGGYTLTYDEENRLVSAGPYISYTYDLLGRRNSTTCFSTTTVYVWDGDHIIAEYRNGSLIRKYIYGPGIDKPVAMINVSGGNETWYYYYADALGSIRLITHASGVPVESYTYDVYGQPRVMYGAGDDGNWLTEDAGTCYVSEVGNPYMFTGRWWDWYTSLYYYRARDYSPTLGRFLQPDPIGYADSMNLYQYCGNNPINWIDPWGLCGEDEDSGFWDYMDESFTWPWNIGDEAFEMEGEEYGDYADPFQGDYRHAAAAAMAARGYGLIPSGLFLLYHQRSESDPNDAAAEWRGWRNAWLHPFTPARELAKDLTRRPVGPKKPREGK